MLVAPLPLVGRFVGSNLTNSAQEGMLVTASSTAHVKGAWASLLDPTPRETHLLHLKIDSVASSNVLTSMLMDIAYGPTGGGNEQILIPDLDVGAAPLLGKAYRFPLVVPAGVRLSARCQAVIASDTARVKLMLAAMAPDRRFPCGPVVAYGITASASEGTQHNEGSGTWGAWVSLGTTSRRHRLWTIGSDQGGDNSNVLNISTRQLGIGPDSGNVTPIAQFVVCTTGAETISGPVPDLAYAPVPSGTGLWLRSQGISGVGNVGACAYGM